MAEKKKKKKADVEELHEEEVAEESVATATDEAESSDSGQSSDSGRSSDSGESSDSESDSSSSDSDSSDSDDDHDHDHDHDHDEEDDFEWAEEPKFEVSYKGDCAYEVKATIAPANEVKMAGKVYEEIQSETELPGFRRGKAPRKLVEKKFAKVVKGDVEGKLVGLAFKKLIDDEDLKPLGYPDIDGLEELKERKDGEPINVTLKFEVGPRIELGKYRGIEVEKPIVVIDDRDVEEQVGEMLKRSATFEAMDVAADNGDQVIIDFKGTIAGEVFEGGSAENYPYIVGSGRFFPEFEASLVGAKPGSTVECDVTFPDDYFSEDLRGKAAHFEIKVNEVKRRVVPTLDDELATELGHESADELRANVRKHLEDSAKARSQQIAESRALRTVVEGSTYEIPATIINRVANESREEEIRRLMGARIPMHAIQERMAEIEEGARKAAMDDIKTIVALNEIGEAEGIEITDDDWEQHAERMSNRLGLDAEAVSQYLATSKERDSYADRIYRAKALAAIMDNANVTEKELSRDEMDEADESRNKGDDD